MRGKLFLRRAGHIFFWGTLGVLAVNLGLTLRHSWAPIKAQAASAHSYTVVRTENVFDKAGSLRGTNEYVEAQRSDGSSMRQSTTPFAQQRTIYFVNGDEIRTNELLRRMSTYPKKGSGMPVRRDPSASCQSTETSKSGWVLEGTAESIGGYRAARHKVVHSGRTWIQWFALDAGCVLLQQRYEDGEGVSMQTLTSLVVSEPNPVLFEVPANFQEVPPSGLYEPVCYRGKCDSVPDAVKQKLDNTYYRVRAKN